MAVRLPDTRRSLPMALLRARETVMTGFRPILAAHGVTEQQWRVLRVLGEYGPSDVTDLSEITFLLMPSLTRMTKGLEARGLVTRRRHDGDGRRLILDITEDGRSLLDSVTPKSAAVYREIEERFGAERLDQLLDLLEEIVDRSGDQSSG